MPNTLVHLGVQALVTRAVVRDADEKWIYIGCIIPDIGWILGRAAGAVLPPALWPHVKAYAIVQTTLFCSLLLASALSLCTRKPRVTFAILSFNIFLHLLLDASEIKWANGIILFAPLSWELLNWGVVWPDSWLMHALTAMGLLYVVLTTRRAINRGFDLRSPGWARGALAAALGSAFFVVPLLFLSQQNITDGHYVETLRRTPGRTGAYVEFDRARVERREGRSALRTLVTDSPLPVIGLDLPDETVVSIRGRFVDENTIQVIEYHDHGGAGRDAASILGLALSALMLLMACVRGLRRSRRGGAKLADLGSA